MASSPAKKLTAVKPSGKTAAKPAARTGAKAAPKIAVVTDGEAGEAEVSATAPQLRIKDLVEQVAVATGGKKPAVREVVEATLAAIGAALDKGDALNLPPLGKARVGRTKTGDQGAMLTLKLKRGGGTKPAKSAGKTDEKEPLAEDGEDS